MDIFEELTKYKQLLDQGIITQDEFDEKKSNLLKKNAIHEHLSIGARVASDSFGVLKKKTESTYRLIKKTGNAWIEKELEKDRINEERKKATKNRRQQTKLNNAKDVTRTQENRITKAGHYAKRILFFTLIVTIIVMAALTVLFLCREKMRFSAEKKDTIHNLEYSVSKDYKKRSQSNSSDEAAINAEKNVFDVYNKSGTLIATYSIEYLGEDIDLDKYKEKICRTLFKHSINQTDNSITIDGYYKNNNLTIQNIAGNGLVKQRVMLFSKDYSCFMVMLKCNAWNYSEKECERLFDSIKLKQYKNRNIAKSLNITYTGSYKNGYEPTQRDFKVEVEYKNGKRSVAEVFDLHAPKQLKEKDNEVIIECHGIKKRVQLIESEEDNGDKDTQNDSLENRDDSPFIDGGLQA